MSPKRAAKIRKEIYKDMASTLESRSYLRHTKTGQIIADELRRRYQEAKKAWVRRNK